MTTSVQKTVGYLSVLMASITPSNVVAQQQRLQAKQMLTVSGDFHMHRKIKLTNFQAQIAPS